MKRRLAACLLPLLAAGPGLSMADSGPGCGFGQQIFAGQSGLMAHVLAATTNGSSSNQLFGLSFDSLGCDGESVITAEFQRNVFVANNLDSIAQDAAKGGGAHLQSLATLMQMPDTDAQKFFRLTQVHYDELFGQPAGDYSAWLAKLDSTLASDPALSRYVTMTHGS